jgi:UDP-N-acetyl-2-amino-2-deoxyglucuronate dehydrogenase
MKIFNIAIIGCGRIVQKHLDAIDANPQANLVAVCDIIVEKAKKIGLARNISYFTDYITMLTKIDVDIVCVLTDSANHAKIVIDVAPYKKHIIVEKPMALALSDADNMIKACDENGIKLFVVKQNRFNKAIQITRKALEAGRFGKLVLGTVRVRWSRNQEYYDQADWRGTWWGDGGVLTNQASHHVDLLEWMFGEVDSVMCMTKTQLVQIETEDTAVAILKFKNGALGVIEATTATRPSDLEGSLSILGSTGSVVIGGFAVNKIDTWQFVNNNPEDAAVINSFKEQPPNVYGYGHIEYLKNVIYSIENNSRALVEGLDGRKSLELINALYESSETGKEVFLHFKPNRCKLGQRSNQK